MSRAPRANNHTNSTQEEEAEGGEEPKALGHRAVRKPQIWRPTKYTGAEPPAQPLLPPVPQEKSPRHHSICCHSLPCPRNLWLGSSQHPSSGHQMMSQKSPGSIPVTEETTRWPLIWGGSYHWSTKPNQKPQSSHLDVLLEVQVSLRTYGYPTDAKTKGLGPRKKTRPN